MASSRESWAKRGNSGENGEPGGKFCWKRGERRLRGPADSHLPVSAAWCCLSSSKETVSLNSLSGSPYATVEFPLQLLFIGVQQSVV